MKSHRIPACLVCLGLALCVPRLVQAQEEPPTDCQLGQQLRLTLGLGPEGMAVMGVSQATHGALATAAEQFCTANRETIEPVLAAAQAAKKAAFEAYESGATDIASKDQACRDALAALKTACGTLMTAVNNALTSQQQALFAHHSEHPLMDVQLGMLDLTTQQVSSIRVAQQARDEVFRHHKLRKNLATVKQAHETFVSALGSILTAGQQTEQAQLTTTLFDNLPNATAWEEAQCGA